MCTKEEKFFTPLSAAEYRLLDTLCLLSTNNVVKASMAELARYTQSSEESVRRALRGLESKELIATTRTKRNLGKLSYNEYRLISPSHKNVGLTSPSHNLPAHKNVGSTAVTGNISNISNYLKVNKTTSYLVPSGTKGEEKRKSFIVVNKWTDDDQVGGFGLFDDEIAAKVAGPKPSKRNPKTRHQRPQEEWTAADVASEFSSRVYKAIPGVPNLVNTEKVRGALSKIRKDFDSNALIELEIMKIFFEDPWLVRQGKENPQWIAGRFLKMFTQHFDQALRNLGLPPRETPNEQDVTIDVAEFVYASDGRRFDNSMPGRAAMSRYEDKLRRNNAV